MLRHRSNRVDDSRPMSRAKDNCLMTVFPLGRQTGRDVVRSISHIRCLFTGCQKAPFEKGFEPCGFGKKSWPASNVHWTFGTRKEKPKLGHRQGDCESIGFDADRDYCGSRTCLRGWFFEIGLLRALRQPASQRLAAEIEWSQCNFPLTTAENNIDTPKSGYVALDFAIRDCKLRVCR